MASLVWLLIPLTAAVIAAIWASWATRHQKNAGAGDAAGVAGYVAFRNAMERSHTPDSSAATTSIPSRIPTGMTSDGPSQAAD